MDPGKAPSKKSKERGLESLQDETGPSGDSGHSGYGHTSTSVVLGVSDSQGEGGLGAILGVVSASSCSPVSSLDEAAYKAAVSAGARAGVGQGAGAGTAAETGAGAGVGDMRLTHTHNALGPGGKPITVSTGFVSKSRYISEDTPKASGDEAEEVGDLLTDSLTE